MFHSCLKYYDFAFTDSHIPENKRADTTICLKATAGLRRLSSEEQHFLITTVHDHFEGSAYAFLPAHTAVIPGNEEALFGYLAVMVAMEEAGKGVGVLDLGGASKQISYIIPQSSLSAVDGGMELAAEVTTEGDVRETAPGSDRDERRSDDDDTECVPDYVLHLPGSSAPVGLVARSVQGMGLLAAMDLVVDSFVTRGDAGEEHVRPQPCLAVGETERGA